MPLKWTRSLSLSQSGFKGTVMHESEWIRKRTAQNILNAFHFSEWLGVALNVYVVILLEDSISQSSSTAFKKIIHKHNTWLSYKRNKGFIDLAPTYVFSHENPNDNPHVNWVLHVPQNCLKEFSAKLPKWVEAVQGPIIENTISCQIINESGYMAVARYSVKGLNPEFIDHFGMRNLYDRKGAQGTIYGQRAGFSRSLGPKAIKNAKFNTMRYYQRRKAIRLT